MTTKFNVILEPIGDEIDIESPLITTVRSIIEQLNSLKNVLKNPEKYTILWYYDSNGVECVAQIVNLDTEVHLPSNSNDLQLYCGNHSMCDVKEVSIMVGKTPFDEDELSSPHITDKTLKLPSIITSNTHLIQCVASSLGCDPGSILDIYEEDSVVNITYVRNIHEYGDPLHYLTIIVDKTTMIDMYTNEMKMKFDELITVFKKNMESLI